MLNLLYAKDTQTAESLHNEVLTSTTRKLGSNLVHETQASSRRQKGIKEELSRRIRLMQKIPDSHPREIFVYNDKGFKSFTPEVMDILGRDFQHRPQKLAVPKYLDYTRGMLKDEIEKGKKAQPDSKKVEKGQEGGDDQLREEYEQLVEEFGAMETEHEQLIAKYRQLRKDHAELQKEHERTLRELSGSKENETKAPEQKTASAPLMRSREEITKQPPVLEYKSFPPVMNKQTGETQEAQEAREGASVQARGNEAREQEEAKIREWEEENFAKEMKKRERELREERAVREQQRLRAPPKEFPGAGSLDVKAEGSAPQVPRHSIHGGVVDSQPIPWTGNMGEPLQGQKTGYPNRQQYLPYQPKHAFLRQANDLKSVSFDLPLKTPNLNQEPSAEQKSDSIQQTDSPKSVSAGHSLGTPSMGRIFPTQKTLAHEPPVQQTSLPQAPRQQSPSHQFPFQQRSARLQQANDPRSFPFGLPTGTPNMGQAFPVQQESAPLQQTSISKSVPIGLRTRTPQMDQVIPTQQQSAPLLHTDLPTRVPFGHETRTPNMGQVLPVSQLPNRQLPVEQKSAPLGQTNESKNVSFKLPSMTPSTPTDSSD